MSKLLHGLSGRMCLKLQLWLLLLCGLSHTAAAQQTVEFLQGAFTTYENSTNATIIVIRAGGSGGSITVDYSTFPGSATSPDDYSPVAGTLTFGDGEVVKVFEVPLLDDGAPESDETVGLALLNPNGATLGGLANATLTLFDDDTQFSFQSATFTVNEAAGNALITVTRSPVSAGSASVQFLTTLGTNNPATPGQDYVNISTNLVFTNGQSSFVVQVPIINDCLVETNNETLLLQLTNALTAVVGAPDVAELTIVSDDTDAGTIEFSTIGPSTIIEGGVITTVNIPVGRFCESDGAVTVEYRIRNSDPFSTFCLGTTNATLGLDYTIGGSGTLSWADGDLASKTITLTVTNDDQVELDETIVVELINPTGGAVIGTARPVYLVVITDNERPAGAADANYNRLTPANPTPGANNVVYGIATYTDPNSVHFGKSIIVGDFTAVNAQVRNRVARLNADGSVDGSFNPGTGADAFISSVAIQQDGKIVLGGGFLSFNNLPHSGIVRLNANGSVDSTFNTGAGSDGPVYSLAVQPDGRILVAGAFEKFNNTTRMGMARLAANGVLDAAFDPIADGPVWSIVMEPNSTLTVDPRSGSGDSEFRHEVVVGLNPGVATINYDFLFGDASLRVYYGSSLLFDTGSTNGARTINVPFSGGASTLAIVINEGSVGDADWTFSGRISISGTKIYAGGDFSSIDGQQASRIARLTQNGAFDSTFTPISGPDNTVYTIRPTPSAQILLGGAFTSYDGKPSPGIVRVNADGSIDQGFNPGTGTDGPVFSIVLQANNAAVVGGEFSRFNGTTRRNIMRLHPNGTLDTSFLDITYNQTQPGADSVVYAVALEPDEDVLIGGGFSVLGGGFTQTDTIPRFYIGKLFGGITQPPFNEPGNIEFVSATYNVDEHVLGGVVSLGVRRINGAVGTARIAYTTFNGSAVSNVDYVSASGTIGWNDCDSLTQFINIPILDNSLLEGNRSFFVKISSPTGLVAGSLASQPALGFQTLAEVVIVDNDFSRGSIGFASPVYSITESEVLSERRIDITLTRTNGSTGRVTLQYATSNGSATAPSDYSSTSGTLTFDSGETTKTFPINIVNDIAVEFEETVNLRLFNIQGGATFGRTNATLLIWDNENGKGSISLSTNQFRVSESNGTATITVRRTSGSSGTVGATIVTEELPPGNGAARAGVDYSSVTNVITFADGVTTRTIVVPLTQDAFVEGDEVLKIIVTNVTGGASLGFVNRGDLVIEDDDAYGKLTFANKSFFYNEIDGTAAITVQRLGGTSEQVTVDYLAGGGTAIDGLDYVSSSGTLVFPDGVTTATFNLQILDDSLLEAYESINLVLQNFSKASPGAFSDAVLTIIDDETLHSPAGTVNTGFRAGPNDSVNSIAVQDDAKLIIGGSFTAVDGVSRNRIARLNANGSLDISFNPGAGANGVVNAVAVQPDQKVLLGGSFSAVGAFNRGGIARLNTDGTLDSSFNPGSGADNPVYAVAVQGDGKIVLAGAFTTVNGFQRRNIARLNSNGSVDTGFSPGVGPNATIHALALQPDGKIIVAGDFIAIDNFTRYRVARLNTDGSVDLTFNPNLGANDTVRCVVVQSDGRIVLAGSFTTMDGLDRNHVARLNSDGSLDTGFLAGQSGANNTVYALALQSDNKILVGGDFSRFNGVTRNRLTRLNPDGTTDASINFGIGANGYIAAVTLQSDRQIAIGGGFTSFNNAPRPYLALLVGGSNTGGGTIEFAEEELFIDEFSTNAVITVYRSGGTLGNVSVSFHTEPGGALSDVDYIPQTNVINFAEGETVQTVAVGIINDAEVEVDELLNIILTNPAGGASIGQLSSATLSIRSDDAVIGFTTATFSVNEGVAGGNAVVTVERTGGSNATVRVNYATITGGTATPNQDFFNRSGNLSFAPGETLKTFNVPIINDGTVEGDETIRISLTSPSGPATLGRSAGTITIVDNDFGPGTLTFTSTNYFIAENGGTAIITVVRTNGTTGVVSAKYATSDGSATAPSDYQAQQGTLAFANGETSKTFPVPIANDALGEGNETINLRLFEPTGGAVIGITNALLTILDNVVNTNDTSPGVLGFSSVIYRAPEGSSNAFVTISRTNGSFGIVSVWLATSPGSATADVDYETSSNQVVFANGITAITVPITLIDDPVIEGNETVILTLFNPSSSTALYSTNAVLIIDDDESGAGNIDLQFDPGSGPNDLVRAVAVQPDGRILVGGAFTNFSGITRTYLARLNTNGVLDTNFNAGAGPNGYIASIALNKSGKIVVGGAFNTVNGQIRKNVAQFTDAGALDVIFNQSNNLNAAVYSVLPRPDDKVVVGGGFSLPLPGLARLRPDGSADVAFFLGAGVNGLVYSVGAHADGHLFLGGDFTLVDNEPRSKIARLFPDGTLDGGFVGPEIFSGQVFALAVQPDRKVIIGGAFTAVDGFARLRIARLNVDGSVDETFADNAGVNGAVYTIALQTDGKIIIGGAFSSVAGVARNNIARLTANGTTDINFDPGLGANGPVYSVSLAPDGKVIIGGEFTRINGFLRKGIARLHGDTPAIRAFAESASRVMPFSFISISQPGAQYVLEGTDGTTPWSALSSTVALGTTVTLTDTNSVAQPHRFYRVRHVIP